MLRKRGEQMKAIKYKAVSKDEKCPRCGDRLPQYEVSWKDEKGNDQREKSCLPCYQLMQIESARKPTGKGELCVLNYAKNAATVQVGKWAEEKLSRFVFRCDKYSVTVYLSLKTSQLHAGDVCVKHRIPKRPKKNKTWKQWMEGRVLVREDLAYPHVTKVATGTCQVKDKVSLALGCDKWWPEYEDVTFHDQAEAFAYGVGYACFKLLRVMKLIPGLATKTGCRKAGVLWLSEFREWRAKQKKSSEKPLAYAQA